MNRFRITRTRALTLLVVLILHSGGCSVTPGPYCIQQYSDKHYARLDANSKNWWTKSIHFFDEVKDEYTTLSEGRVGSPIHLTLLDEATFKKEVAAGRAKAHQEYVARTAKKETERKESQERYELERRIYQKDYERWYEIFLNQGYLPDEARFKTTQMMRGR